MNMRKLLGAAGVACFMAICSGGVSGMSMKSWGDAVTSGSTDLVKIRAFLNTDANKTTYSELNTVVELAEKGTITNEDFKKVLCCIGGYISDSNRKGSEIPDANTVCEDCGIYLVKNDADAAGFLKFSLPVLVKGEATLNAAKARAKTPEEEGILNAVSATWSKVSSERGTGSLFEEIQGAKRCALLELGLSDSAVDELGVLFGFILRNVERGSVDDIFSGLMEGSEVTIDSKSIRFDMKSGDIYSFFHGDATRCLTLCKHIVKTKTGKDLTEVESGWNFDIKNEGELVDFLSKHRPELKGNIEENVVNDLESSFCKFALKAKGWATASNRKIVDADLCGKMGVGSHIYDLIDSLKKKGA